jgi:cytochrome c peroxidase
MRRHLFASFPPASLSLASLWLGTACLETTPVLPQPHEPKSEVVAKQAAPGAVSVDDARLGLFKPALPPEFGVPGQPASADKIALGRMLYYETRLSKNHDVSCNSCHSLTGFGVDGTKVSVGHKKQQGSRNAPTVYNAAGHFVQFWDGRAKDVEEQAQGPVLNPVEMAMPAAPKVEATLRSIPGYVEAFKKAFPDMPQPVTLANAAAAIGAFERKLVTPSRWDKFLAGDPGALTEAEQVGLGRFLAVGCNACHIGTLLGGSMFQKAGLRKPWPTDADGGRFAVTKQEADRMMFKVPSLRNVEKTAPYFHDGSVATLEEAVRTMGRHQLGLELADADVASITTFLKSLTGTIPQEYVQAPTLPPNGPKTPKPDPR